MEVLERARAIERQGARVIHLEVGEPDFPAPPEAVEACRQALARGETGYTDSRGILELREAIADEHARRSGRPVGAERVLVANGTSPALFLALAALLDAGDEVILATPHYAAYPNIVRAAGGVPVPVLTRAERGHRLDPEAVARAVTPRTRAVLLNSPSNPTGAVQPREVVAKLAELGPALISDEIYAGLVYGGAEACSALSLSDGAFVLDGFSKRFAMTGFRVGYVIAPPEALRALQSLAQNLFISASPFSQRAALAALEHGAPAAEEMRRALESRRAQLLDGLRGLGFELPAAPEGAFYLLADARRFDVDSRRLAFRLLEEGHVAVAPGIDFGEAGEGHLRFSYTASPRDIDEALTRLRKLL
ncbi:MAG: pyridoxal phosphate-dependent aminotransferase [Proteobacteria bacterium]|nr:pyridoxal phosphate-dependent aminotransferase [Pseudomonadota bacterium]